MNPSDVAKVTIDTNVSMYAIDNADLNKHQTVHTLLGTLVEQDTVVSVQALAEFFHIVTQGRSMNESTMGHVDASPPHPSPLPDPHPSLSQRERDLMSVWERGSNETPRRSARTGGGLDASTSVFPSEFDTRDWHVSLPS